MYDIFNPKDLSDDDLFERIQKANHFLGVHISQGHDSLVHNLHILIAVMEEEQEYRSLKRKTEHEDEIKKRLKASNKRKGKDTEISKDVENGTSTLGRIDGIDD